MVTPKAEVTFQYDPLGRRTEKRVIRWHDEDGDHEPDEDEEGRPRVIRYLYNQEDILAMFTDSGREIARYTHGPGIDEPLAELRSHWTRFYHADSLGTILALTEKHGHPVRHYQYSAFGVPEDHRGDPQPYRFTGREWDKEVDLYFYRARYYQSRSGRFLTEDPIGLLGGVNSYRYGLNNPLYFSDPLGLDVTVILYRGAGVFGHIGVGINAMSTVGHYPSKHSIDVLVGVDVPGKVISDSLQKGAYDVLDTITIRTTKAQDKAMLRIINEYRDKNRYYNLYFWNCATFVQEVLRAGGVKFSDTTFPTDLMRQLRQTYGEQSGIFMGEQISLPSGFAP